MLNLPSGVLQCMHVTSPADDGPGSLREAVTRSSGPRLVIFQEPGEIRLKSDLLIRQDNTHILGRAGLSITGATVRVEGADWGSLTGLRIRPGDAPGPSLTNRDCLRFVSARHWDVNQCSLEFGTDENLDIFTGCRQISVRNTIIGWGLRGERGHSTGARIGPDAREILFDCNLFAHNHRRNCLIANDCTVDLVNNVDYNPGSQSIGLGGAGTGPIQLCALGNVMQPGPNTSSRTQCLQIEALCDPKSRVYLYDNYGRGAHDWDTVTFLDGAPSMAAIRVWKMPARFSKSKPLHFTEVMPYVLENVGARPLDKIDRRLLDGVRTKTGRIIDTPGDIYRG